MYPISVSVSPMSGYAKSASKKLGILLTRSNASVFYTMAFMGSPMSLHQRSLVCTWISPCQNPSTPLSGWSALPQLFVSSRASRHYLPLGNSSLGFLSFRPASLTRERTKLNLVCFFFWNASTQLLQMVWHCFNIRHNCFIIKPVRVSVDARDNRDISVMIVCNMETEAALITW